MHETLAAVEAFLAREGVLRTRLREHSTGDLLDLMPIEPLALPGLAPTVVVAALVTLEHRGIVQRACERVHSHDSTEYYVTWRLGRRAPQPALVASARPA